MTFEYLKSLQEQAQQGQTVLQNYQGARLPFLEISQYYHLLQE